MNSSVVLVAIVGLWLVWVAPYVLRIRRPAWSAEPVGASASVPPATAESHVSQGSFMEMSGHRNDAFEPLTAGSAPLVSAGQQRLKIRPGRTSIAAVGALSLLAAIIGLPLASFGMVPALVPGVALVIFVLAVAGLRFLAVRARRRRVDEAFADAMSARSVITPSTPIPLHAPRRETSLFDAETSSPAAGVDSVADERRTRFEHPTAADLRQAAFAVAAGVGQSPATRLATPGGDAATQTPVAHSIGATWHPVEVPKPMYVAAAKAERQAPAALELPDAPKAQAKTSLKQGAIPPSLEGAATSVGSTAAATPATGRINLDDVLQRRRA